MLFNSVLSDKGIRKFIKKGKLVTSSVIEEQYQPNSLDVRLGLGAKILKNEFASPVWEDIPFGDDGDIKFIQVKPKQFMLLHTMDVFDIPNGIVGFIHGRSSIARMGIQVEQAGLIDSGFSGTLTLEIYNQTEFPIQLEYGMRIAQVHFMKCQKSLKLYGTLIGSKYNGQLEPTPSMLENR